MGSREDRGWLVPKALALAGGLLALLTASAWSDDIRYLRVGTGPPGESYFPMGGLIASAISNPPGSRPCNRGGNCGVPDLIAVAMATSGSVNNVEAIGDGRMDAALIQADIAMWAVQRQPPFEGRPVIDLRSVANLYPGQFHLVAVPRQKSTRRAI